MKRILCYGDSNTWGYDPISKDRFADKIRWTGVLSDSLGSDYTVIEEGLGGRTTVWDDPIEGYKNGLTYLIPCLQSHSPLDLVIIMLGTNDLKKRFSLSAYDIAQGAAVLVRAVRQSQTGRNQNVPAVLLLSPPKAAKLTDFAQMFEEAEAKSAGFSEEFSRISKDLDCPLLDTSTVVVASQADGIHLEAAQHKLLGEAVSRKVKALIG